jgi:N-methylhydantoinase A
VDGHQVTFRYGIDARYVGQGNEITVWLGEGERWPVSVERACAVFAEEYEAVYGLSIPDVPVEVVTWRLSATAPTPVVDLTISSSGVPSQAKGSRTACFGRHAQGVETPVYERGSLQARSRIRGPAVIEERETTIVLRPGWDAQVLDAGVIVATREVG